MKRPDDQRDRYLSAEELCRLKQALDEIMAGLDNLVQPGVGHG